MLGRSCLFVKIDGHIPVCRNTPNRPLAGLALHPLSGCVCVKYLQAVADYGHVATSCVYVSNKFSILRLGVGDEPVCRNPNHFFALCGFRRLRRLIFGKTGAGGASQKGK